MAAKKQGGQDMNTRLLAMYGLKYNPFLAGVPTDALHVSPGLESFFWRIEHALIQEGGFGLICGDPGTGKSAALRILSERLGRIRDVQVGALAHASARLSDFYRELGDIFGVPLNAHNRWLGFKQLRERWLQHMGSTLTHPVLLVDEAQEMPACVLNELRLLTSAQYDSRQLLCVILAGDGRLKEKLRRDELVPLGSRIRVRFNTEQASPEQLGKVLQRLLESAGNASLMTGELIQTLSEHAMGNYRALCTMASELLDTAVRQEKGQLDGKLYLECFAVPPAARKQRHAASGGIHG
jgi:general secretion pathway protein A